MHGIWFKCKLCGQTGHVGYTGGITGTGSTLARRCRLCGISVCSRDTCARTRFTESDDQLKVCLPCAKTRGWDQGLPEKIDSVEQTRPDTQPRSLLPLLERDARSPGYAKGAAYASPDIPPGLELVDALGTDAATIRGKLAAALRDPDRLVRAFAAWGLARAEKEIAESCDDLLPATRDVDAEVREYAAWGLGNLALRLLREDEFRLRACSPVARLRASARALVIALGDASADVRSTALASLQCFRVEEEALAAQLASLISAHDDKEWRDGLRQVLRTMGPAARPLVAQSIRTLEGPEAAQAVSLLGCIGKDAAEAVPALLERAARAGDGPERSLVIHALGRIAARPELVLPAIVAYLGNSHRQTPQRIWEVVAVFPAPRPAAAVVKLIDAARLQLERQDEPARVEALARLGSLGADAASAVDPIARCVDDASVPVRDAALKALRAIGKPAAKVLLPMLAGPDPRRQRSAAIGLARAGIEVAAALEILMAPLRGPAGSKLGPAIEALAETGAVAAPAVPRMLALFPAANALLREKLCRALVAVGEPAAKGIAGLLSDPAPAVRRRAAQMLLELGPAAAAQTEALRRALSDADPEARAAIARALEALTPRQS